jgi:HSP20 family protein
MMKPLAMRILPFRRLETFPGNINELFGPFFNDWAQVGMPERSAPTGYVPQIASYLDGSTFRINADLPGVEPSEIELTVKDNQLTLSGERKAAPEQQNGNRFQQEMRYGPFARTFTLPEGMTAEELHARYHNGVLEITASVPAAKLSKKIPIQIAQIASDEPRTIAA